MNGLFWLEIREFAPLLPGNIKGVALMRPDIYSASWSRPLKNGLRGFSRYSFSKRSVFFEERDALRSVNALTMPPLPPGTNDVTFKYSVPVGRPEAMRMQDRLIGYSDGWSPHSLGAPAVYTNLRPGRYRYEVRNHYADPESREAQAAVDFEILPAFYQTTWFKLTCYALAALAAYLLFRFEVHRASERRRRESDAREMERERIARELHDTTLQGVQGLIMRIHAVLLRMNEKVPERGDLERALVRAEEVLIEGRDRITQLRDRSTEGFGFAAGIQALCERLAEPPYAITCVVRGTPRRVHRVVEEEALLIVREAVQNAVRHSNGTAVDVDIHFERSALRIVITDNGRGMPSDQALAAARQGHWGITGMHERAKRLRGNLRLRSSPTNGTTLELRIPALVAYWRMKRRLGRRALQ